MVYSPHPTYFYVQLDEHGGKVLHADLIKHGCHLLAWARPAVSMRVGWGVICTKWYYCMKTHTHVRTYVVSSPDLPSTLHTHYTRETLELSSSKLDVQKRTLQWNLSDMDVTLGTKILVLIIVR